MRQIQILVDRSYADEIAQLAAARGAAAVAVLSVSGPNGEAKGLVTAAVPNDALGTLIERCEEIAPAAEFVFLPTGAISLSTPLAEVEEIVRSVEPRSPLELVVGALQSLGGWQGMLTYSAFSGVVAAYAVLFDLTYLLVAAMLIAPLGAPAMVTVAGATLGDGFMVRRGMVRFFVAIAMLAGTAILVGLAYGIQVSTATMESITGLSHWTALVAIAGGAAGAAAQIRSSRDSLVTGTATGFLVAVSLSPPSAVLGLALTMQRWDYVGQMTLNLVLMYAGIVVGGSLMLLIHGVHPRVTAAHRGSDGMRWTAIATAVLILVGMMTVQGMQGIAYSKADASHRSLTVIRDALDGVSGARLVDASTRFTRQDLSDGERQTMYVTVVAEPVGDLDVTEDQVRDAVAQQLARELPGIIPYIDVSLVSPANVQ